MDCKELHFMILNMVLKVIHQSWYYCFCDKYSGCTNISGAKEYCAICRIAVDFNDIKRIYDFAQFKFHELLKIGDQLRPLVREAMDYGPKDCQHFFDDSDEFCFSHSDSYTGKYEYPLSEWIKSLTKTKKRMGEENYFKSHY